MKFLLISVLVLAVILFIKRGSIIASVAKIQHSKGDTKKAIELFRLAEKVGKLNIGDKMYFGYLLLRSGNLEDARTTLAMASMMYGKEPIKNRIKAVRALVYWKEGNLDDAIDTLENLIEDFKTTSVYQNLGLFYVLKGNKEKALDFNLEAYDYNCDDLVIMDNLAEAYALCEMFDEAEDMYKKLLEKEPHFPEAYYGYGLLLIQKGEKEKGLSLMKESLDKRFSYLSVMQKEDVEDLIKKYE